MNSDIFERVGAGYKIMFYMACTRTLKELELEYFHLCIVKKRQTCTNISSSLFVIHKAVVD